jgi:hypothetical protein
MTVLSGQALASAHPETLIFPLLVIPAQAEIQVLRGVPGTRFPPSRE